MDKTLTVEARNKTFQKKKIIIKHFTGMKLYRINKAWFQHSNDLTVHARKRVKCHSQTWFQLKKVTIGWKKGRGWSCIP